MKRISIFIVSLLWCMPLKAQPDTLWTKTFGGSNGDWGFSVQQTSDGGYIILGGTVSYGAGEIDAWLIKTDTSGDTLWTKTFGGGGSDWGFSVQQTSDGGYIIGGSTSSYGAGSDDAWLIKTDTSGHTLWTETFGGSNSDYGGSVQETYDGGYIITGSTTSYGAGEHDVWLIKTNSSGDTLWTRTFGGSSIDFGYSVQQTSDGGYIITGETDSYGGDGDAWLIRLAPDTGVVGIEDNPNLIPSSFILRQNYPNPFNPITTFLYDLPEQSYVSITIYDLLGRQVKMLVNQTQDAGFKSTQWDASSVPSGIYFYQINARQKEGGQAGGFVQTRKMVVLK